LSNHRFHTYARFQAPWRIPLSRWVRLLVGLTLFGFGIVLMVKADVGLGPWDVLHQGLSVLFGIRIGRVAIGVGVLLLLLWIPLKERPGIGTVCNAVLIGLVVDLLMPWIGTPEHLVLALLQMGAGVVVIGIGSGLYLTAEMGAGPRDGLMMGLVRVTGLSVRVIRTFIELTVLLGGWLLGGSIGIGTLAFAFGIGPVIQATLAFLTRTGDLAKT
jgi:uncharacterized membrane protein YczE